MHCRTRAGAAEAPFVVRKTYSKPTSFASLIASGSHRHWKDSPTKNGASSTTPAARISRRRREYSARSISPSGVALMLLAQNVHLYGQWLVISILHDRGAGATAARTGMLVTKSTRCVIDMAFLQKDLRYAHLRHAVLGGNVLLLFAACIHGSYNGSIHSLRLPL